MNKRLTVILIVAALIATSALLYFYLNKSSDTNTQSKTCTTYGGKAEEQCVEDYIGLTQQEAVSRAEQYNYIPKVVKIDGENRGFLDIGGASIYLEVEDGIVIKAYFEDSRS